MNIPTEMVSLFCGEAGEDCEAISAAVESSDDGRVVVVVEDGGAARCAAGCACEVRYTDPRDGRFMGVACDVESVDGARLTLRAVTETRSANQRSSFRVSTVCSGITARVGAHADCRVVDVSAAGICVQVPAGLRVGDSVVVRIHAGEKRIDGRFSVRRVGEARDGAQVGMSADPEDKRLAEALADLTSDMQREQLRRRSRVAGGNGESPEPGEGPGEGEDAGAAASERPDQDDAWVCVPASALAGQALPGPLVSEAGERVAERGQVLSLDDIRRLAKDGLYATDDWSGKRADRRVNQRSACARTVRVVALQGKHVMRMRAELTDISRGGVGLRAPMLLRADDYLVVDFSTSEDSCWVIGKVVHGSLGEGETSCRIGIQFHMDSVRHERVPESEPELAQWISVKPARGAAQRAS